MLLYSTKNYEHQVKLDEAIFQGLPPDNGLYMPKKIGRLPRSFFNNIDQYSFQDIGFEVCKKLFDGYIPEKDIRKIVETAIDFPAPIVKLDKHKSILELFHGPSLAFKDFGARFMAQLMAYFSKDQEQELTILVATSGDTGGAVASGFYKTAGIKVVILYPSGKVSPLQEKQLTTLGHNITALEVDGTFDDCQALVKQAFIDTELRAKKRLSSANSINIARLIPQSFYYFEAFKQLKDIEKDLVFAIPSGNFGNLTAGLLAHQMGLNVKQFIAATNANNIVPEYLNTGSYNPKSSQRTLSNAMDVGNPSNFARMIDLFSLTKGSAHNEDIDVWQSMNDLISGYSFSDTATTEAIQRVNKEQQYTLDPHAAVAYLALEAYQKSHTNTHGVILETAHPAKFKEDMEQILDALIDIPERLATLKDKEKTAQAIGTNYKAFKEWLISQ